MNRRLALVAALLLGACGTLEPSDAAESSGAEAILSTTTESTDMAVTLSPTTPAPTTSAPTTAAPTTRAPTTQTEMTASPDPSAAESTRDEHEYLRTSGRVVAETGYSPFALAGDVVLYLPAAEVEYIGFHESGHDGARQQTVTDDLAVIGLGWTTMETRDRGTGDRTAADIAVAIDMEIRAPVSGTVLRAGGYTLYCEHRDDFVVINPDDHPGWEVKMFHINGVQVFAGDRVEAGVTVIAPAPTQLPFVSQVDEFTAAPSTPHVHIEVVDPSIPDRPSTGGGC